MTPYVYVRDREARRQFSATVGLGGTARNLPGNPCRVKPRPLPTSRNVRRVLARYSAWQDWGFVCGGGPVSGLISVVGKADTLERGHAYRLLAARVVRRHRAIYKRLLAARQNHIGCVLWASILRSEEEEEGN